MSDRRWPKKIFRPERQVAKELKNYYHIDTYRNLSDSSFCLVCVDYQTLELLHSLKEPQRYARWIEDYNGRQVRISKPEDEQFVDSLWAKLQEQIADVACLDELTEVLKEIAKSSRNSDLAMQLLVAQLRKDKTIYDVIPAPTVGGTLTAANDSHFEAASMLETNGIAELFSVAMLDNGTLTFPDLNPFNLQSKVDGIRTDINLSKTHFIGSFSQLVEWFATSFRGGMFSDYNPLGAETFFTRFTNTFNAATPTTVTVPVPWPPFTYTFTFYMVDKTFSERFTQAFFADDQREPTDSQNYFNRFNTKFDLFNVIHEAMKDCICAANGLLETIGGNILGLDTSSTQIVDALDCNTLVTKELVRVQGGADAGCVPGTIPDGTIPQNCQAVAALYDELVNILDWCAWAVEWFIGLLAGPIVNGLLGFKWFTRILFLAGLAEPSPTEEFVTIPLVGVAEILSYVVEKMLLLGAGVAREMVNSLKSNRVAIIDLLCGATDLTIESQIDTAIEMIKNAFADAGVKVIIQDLLSNFFKSSQVKGVILSK